MVSVIVLDYRTYIMLLHGANTRSSGPRSSTGYVWILPRSSHGAQQARRGNQLQADYPHHRRSWLGKYAFPQCLHDARIAREFPWNCDAEEVVHRFV